MIEFDEKGEISEEQERMLEQSAKQKVLLACDHAGFELKEQLKEFLRQKEFFVQDEGAFAFNEVDDYPDFVKLVAKQVSGNPAELKGIIIGGSGQGEAICANRFKNVRAVVYYGGSNDILKLSKEHNNANILSLGARFIDLETAKQAVTLWLESTFSGDDRHIRRIQKIDNDLEEENEF